MNEYYSEEELIFYSSLSESTIYLLGDPDLIALWEDAHKRTGLIKNIKHQEDSKKVKDIGEVNTGQDLHKKLMSVGTRQQNRTLMRITKDGKKETNHKFSDFLKKTNSIYDPSRNSKFKYKTYGNGGTYHYTSDPNEDHGKMNDVHVRLFKMKSDKEKKAQPLKNTGLSALYAHSHKAIGTVKGAEEGHDPEFVKRQKEHEGEHAENMQYVTGKYGKSVANRLFKKSAKASAQAISVTPLDSKELREKKTKAYKHDPLEYNAYAAAGNPKSTKEERHKVLDDAIKGKKTPKVNKSDGVRQFYGNAPVNVLRDKND